MKLSNVVIVLMVLMHSNGTSAYADDIVKKGGLAHVAISGVLAITVCAGMIGKGAFDYTSNYASNCVSDDALKCLMQNINVRPTTESKYCENQSGGPTNNRASSNDIKRERLKFADSARNISIAAKFNQSLDFGQTYQELVDNKIIGPCPPSKFTGNFVILLKDNRFKREVRDLSFMLYKLSDKKLEHDLQYERIKNKLNALTDDDLCQKIEEVKKLLKQKNRKLNTSKMLVLIAEVDAGKTKTMQALLRTFEDHVKIEMSSGDRRAPIDCLHLYVESINRSLVRGSVEYTEVLLDSAKKYFSAFDLYAMACRADSYAMVKKLLDDGVVDIDCDFELAKFSNTHPGSLGRYPIDVACVSGSYRVAELLLQRGAHIGVTNPFSCNSPIGRENRNQVLLGRGLLPISQQLKEYLQDDERMDLQAKKRLSCEYLEYLKNRGKDFLDRHYNWLASVDSTLDGAGLNQQGPRHIALTMVNGLPSIDKKRMAGLQSNQEADDRDENEN